MRLVGICGYSGSGKSIAAAALRQDGFHVYPMAQVLKNMLRAFGLSEAQVCGDQKAVELDLLGGKTPRHAMQTLGTEWGRDLISHDVWLKAWWTKVKHIPAVVCDDVRFGNEAEFIRAQGGRIIKIHRPLGSGALPQHPSEQLAFRPDIEIVNVGTVPELEHKVRQALVNAGV
ncbi:MAG: deoxynucleotide monophosphate kinase [Rickettsiales bacterium]|nr:MAG: deoxynucleotide monophosphate kinase [Rickettsiales bacterium]